MFAYTETRFGSSKQAQRRLEVAPLVGVAGAGLVAAEDR
jgi:hypothetical protein